VRRYISFAQVPVPKLVDGGTWKDFPCGKEYLYKANKAATGTTSSMRDHLITVHAYGKEGGAPEVKQTKLAVGGSGEHAVSQPAKLTSQDPLSQEFFTDMARWIAVDGLPVALVDKPGFGGFCEKRFPRFPVPSRTPITSRLRQFAEAFQQWFIEFHSVVTWFGLTFDGWRSDKKEH
jgi:hypothetical protein